MSIQKYISSYNGEIVLTRSRDVSSLTVDGYVESGKEVEDIWNPTLNKFISPNTSISSVLILGFAAGSVVPLLRARWPDIQLTGVEIDPVMLTIAQSNFPIHTQGVNLINQDATKYVESLTPSQPIFDLVLVDCYLHGDKQLFSTQQLDFLLTLKKVGHQVLMNQLLFPPGIDILKKTAYIPLLNSHYPVQVLRLPHNAMISY